jgi:hypothetical protein
MNPNFFRNDGEPNMENGTEAKQIDDLFSGEIDKSDMSLFTQSYAILSSQ